MKNKKENKYDQTGSSNDFSNNEGFDEYEDYVERKFEKNSRNRFERNDYASAGPATDRQKAYGQGFFGRYEARNSPGATQWNTTSRHSQNQGQWSSPYQSPENSWSQPPSQAQWGTAGAGSHAGKGPKGYNRSDDRIKEDICEMLTHHSEIDATEITVDVKKGIVTLSGTVESRQIKRITEEFVERSSGVKDIQNDLQVKAANGRTLKSTQQ